MRVEQIRAISEFGETHPDRMFDESSLVTDIQFLYDMVLMGLDRPFADG